MSRASSSVPFVAREEQVALLEAAVRRAADGRATTALVAGDAGVGKTRLVESVVDAASDALVLVGHCLDVGGVGLPYLPFAEVLSALHRLAADDPTVAEALARWPAADGISGAGQPATPGDDVGRLQLFDALIGLLTDLSHRAEPTGPVVLVLEDLHWADQSTRELLRFLVARAGGTVAEAREAGDRYADNIGTGILEDYRIVVEPVGDDRVRVTVTGTAQEIAPVGVPRVSQTVEGPIEKFVEGP